MSRILFRGLFLVCAIVPLLLLFTPTHLKDVRKNDAVAISKLRRLATAQQAYANRHPDKGFACRLADLSEASSSSGYQFSLQCDSEAKKSVTEYQVTAEPLELGKTGIDVYCITELQAIWYDHKSATKCLSAKQPFKQ
jgi:hypothetical protein